MKCLIVFQPTVPFSLAILSLFHSPLYLSLSLSLALTYPRKENLFTSLFVRRVRRRLEISYNTAKCARRLLHPYHEIQTVVQRTVKSLNKHFSSFLSEATSKFDKRVRTQTNVYESKDGSCSFAFVRVTSYCSVLFRAFTHSFVKYRPVLTRQTDNYNWSSSWEKASKLPKFIISCRSFERISKVAVTRHFGRWWSRSSGVDIHKNKLISSRITTTNYRGSSPSIYFDLLFRTWICCGINEHTISRVLNVRNTKSYLTAQRTYY